MKRRNMMIKRFFPIFSIMLLLISLVAPGIQPVAAEGKEKKEYEDGTYDVPLKVLHADKDEKSAMQDYVQEGSPSVTIEDGEATVSLTLTSANWITSFLVDDVEVDVIEDNEDDNTSKVSF